MKTILDFARARREQRPLVVVTAYDALMARLVASASVDAILVGDSAAMVVHGLPSTVHATVEMLRTHVAAVRRGAPDLFVIADLPFLTARQGRDVATAAAGVLLQAGENDVKIEGLAGHEDIVAHLVGSGVPVMGHLGLTPQSVHQLGGYRMQGRATHEAERLRQEARQLEQLGAFALVLECVPEALAATVTTDLAIPTIGIGAGGGTAGQVLVLTDLLGLDPDFQPRFARRFLKGHELVHEALTHYATAVRDGSFPARAEVVA